MIQLKLEKGNSFENFVNMLISNLDSICENEEDRYFLLKILETQSFFIDGEGKKDLFDIYFNLGKLKQLFNDEDIEILLKKLKNKLLNNCICEMVEIYKTNLINTLHDEKKPGEVINNGNKLYICTANNEFVYIRDQNHKMSKKLYLCEDNHGYDTIVDANGNIVLSVSCIEQNIDFVDKYIEISCSNEVHFLDENLKSVFPGVSGSHYDVNYYNGQTYLASWDYEKLEQPTYFRTDKRVNFKLYDLNGNIIFSSNDIYEVENIMEFNNGNRFIIGKDNNYNKYIYNMQGQKTPDKAHFIGKIFVFENPIDQEKYFIIENYNSAYIFNNNLNFQLITGNFIGKDFGDNVYFDKNGNIYFELDSMSEKGEIIDSNGKKKSMFTKLINTVQLENVI